MQAEPVPFALYLVYLMQQVRYVAAINSIVDGVSWVHKKGDFLELSQHPVMHVREPARCTPEDHLETTVVRRIVKRQQGNLAELQLVTLIALGFFGFLRWDNLSNLTFDSIHFERSHVVLFLEKCKNDRFRESSWIFISSSEVQEEVQGRSSGKKFRE